jgi:hypothetical protein
VLRIRYKCCVTYLMFSCSVRAPPSATEDYTSSDSLHLGATTEDGVWISVYSGAVRDELGAVVVVLPRILCTLAPIVKL